MTTYTEEKKETTDWWELIELLSNIEDMPPEAEVRNYIYDARKWATCAVGNQCASIPRNNYGEPADPALRELGMLFTDYIDLFAFAKDVKQVNGLATGLVVILEHIEMRSAKVLACMEESDDKEG